MKLIKFDSETKNAAIVSVLSVAVLLGVSATELIIRNGRRNTINKAMSINSSSKSDNNVWRQVVSVIDFHQNLISELMEVSGDASFNDGGSCLLDLIEGRLNYTVPVDDIVKLLSSFDHRFIKLAHKSSRKSDKVLDFDRFVCARAELGAMAYWAILNEVENALNDEVGVRFHEAADRLLNQESDTYMLLECAKDAKMVPNASILIQISNILERYATKMKTRCKQRRKANLRDLGRYLFASSAIKFLCMGGSFAFVSLTSYMMISGQHFRRQIERGVVQAAHNGAARFDTAETAYLLSLVSLEIVRCASTLIVENLQQNFISISTAFNREKIKMRLYLALSMTPLSFFDLHSFDDVEEMVLFVNDLEGVDVHLQTYGSALCKSVIDVAALFSSLARRKGGVWVFGFIFAAVTSANVIEWLIRKVSARALARKVEIADVEELENVGSEVVGANDACGRVLLRGLSVLEHVHSLRPLGADSTMLKWWVTRLQRLIDHRDLGFDVGNTNAHDTLKPSRVGGLLIRVSDRVLMRVVRASVSWIPAFAKSFSIMSQTLLPIVTYALLQSYGEGVKRELTPLYISELVTSVNRLLSVVGDRTRIYDLLYHNAYKAHVLVALLKRGEFDEEALLNHGIPLEITTGVARGTLKPVLLAISNLTFSYPSRPERKVLSSLNLQIPLNKGSFVVITGASGVGKSTLLQLLLRLYDPKEGNIEITFEETSKKGKPALFRKFQLLALPSGTARSIFSFVPQAPTIYSGTVAQNISLEQVVTLADVDVLNRVKAAALSAQCSDFINSLPERYFTNVSQSGAGSEKKIKLSGGQAQRIGIARALYRSNCPILLLDEPTSALDVQTKQELLGTLRGLLLAGSLHCILCVSHDDTLIKAADLVVRMPE